MEGRVWQAAHSIFPVNAVGRSEAVSEFGIEYRYWANGAVLDEGQPAPVWTADRAEQGMLDMVKAYFVEAREAGNTVVVWREFPEFNKLPACEADPVFKEPARPARLLLIMRLHFMPWERFKTLTDEVVKRRWS